MHKRNSLVAAIGLTSALLAGCSSSSSPETKNTEASKSAATTSPANQNIRRAKPSEVAKRVADKGVTVLDVRTAKEFANGHLDGAVNVDYYQSSFAGELEKLDKSKPYVMYCETGNRSAKVAKIMKSQGFTDVEELEGGFSRWQQEGLPVSRG